MPRMTVVASNPVPLRFVADQPARDQESLDVSLLTRQMRDGSDEAWRAFHGQFYLGLLRLAAHRLATPDDALDVMQQVYLRLARHIQVFHDESEFRHWLACVLRCALVDHQRGIRRRAFLLERFAHWQEAQRTTAAPFADLPGTGSATADALAQLSVDEADLLKLKYYEGWSVEQLAVQTGATPKAVENRLARARQRLREVILRIQ